ncbi:Hypothetical protein SMAX5B_002670 [Scophthalmus maximus]|uniref:Uncharacterized protein n=1 Tax=Scophthalmus maximus TaxID=52904 RepID=A0A2U9BYJ1_SCOMX|nr:Hypothetical protein SMAX5B_002670 [Scophthalmus maximus]
MSALLPGHTVSRAAKKLAPYLWTQGIEIKVVLVVKTLQQQDTVGVEQQEERPAIHLEAKAPVSATSRPPAPGKCSASGVAFTSHVWVAKEKGHLSC